jgi:hypothetical protein
LLKQKTLNGSHQVRLGIAGSLHSLGGTCPPDFSSEIGKVLYDAIA